jgi:hypothetical protein
MEDLARMAEANASEELVEEQLYLRLWSLLLSLRVRKRYGAGWKLLRKIRKEKQLAFSVEKIFEHFCN